jgi:tetratricopeptide (TPR) repeat protein
VEGSIRDEAVEPLLTARWNEATVGVQLHRLCAALGWELTGDSDALARLETVRTAVEVTQAPLGEVLSALTDYAGLHWRREGWKCIIVQGKGTGDDVTVFWRAWAWGGEHPWTEAVGLLLANECWNFSEGEWSRKLYRQILETGTHESQRLALYNWALLEWQQGRYAAARARWYDLLDSTPGTLWTPRAHWWLGRVALETGDLTGAEHHWQTVLRSREAEWSAAAVLGLSLVYLLREDVSQMQRLLQHQRLPGREPYIAWADLLEAWWHYQRQPTPGRAGAVADALERIAEASVFGAAGRYWAGQVWRALERPERMVHCYESQPLLGRNPWVVRMWNDVAEYYHQLGLITHSRQRDLALLAVDPDGWGQRAALRLAEAAWQQGQVEECIRQAQRLRRASPELQRAALLLLGRAYERTHRHRQAAECFAGRWPNEE